MHTFGLVLLCHFPVLQIQLSRHLVSVVFAQLTRMTIDQHTDSQTTLRATAVATGCIYALRGNVRWLRRMLPLVDSR